MPGLAVVVVSYNNWAVLERCLAAAQSVCDALGAELIVVDNDSPDRSADRVAEKFPRARLFRRPNKGFAAGVNWGVAATSASRILLLNPDCILDGTTALQTCLDSLDADPRAAAISCHAVDGEGVPYLPCRAFPTLKNYLLERFDALPPYPPPHGGPPRPVAVDTITGAFFLLKREAWAEIGPFDEGFFLYFEETDWCWRAWQAGWRILHDPRVTVLHLGGQSTKTAGGGDVARPLLLTAYLDSRERFWRKCYGAMATLGMRAASIAMSAPSLVASLMKRDSRRQSL
ncbi:MAG TPA: glycosyltransferase family 2 protein, partial [bacterium]|nr:glycosyltransferase family 2 protein [bacterium]